MKITWLVPLESFSVSATLGDSSSELEKKSSIEIQAEINIIVKQSKQQLNENTKLEMWEIIKGQKLTKNKIYVSLKRYIFLSQHQQRPYSLDLISENIHNIGIKQNTVVILLINLSIFICQQLFFKELKQIINKRMILN